MDFLQYVWSGLAAGALYATATMGFTLMYKTTGIINFAYGDMAATGAVMAYWLFSAYHLPYVVAAPLAILLSAVMAILVERGLLRPLQSKDHVLPIIATMGLSQILSGVLHVVIPVPKPFPKPINGETLQVAGVFISPESLMILATAMLIMVVLYLFMTHTVTGIALRATAQDATTSRLMGVPADTVFAVSTVASATLGTVAAMLIAPTTSLYPTFMNSVVLNSFVAAIVGGLGNLPGALLGGLLLGVVENLVAGYISTEIKGVFMFLILLAVMILRPQGIMRISASRRV